MGTWHVTMQFRPGGPAVEGSWSDRAVALGKFRGWLGIHGSRDGVIIVLLEVEETVGEREPLRTWTKERGEVIHRVT
ncbi:hypothetical protein ACIQVK_53555 [Streptomyces sp. NPDC090493]|uniref:hypothetical protein n=1 Tax=Streptomyces sp. NPDC090493 TaxID=3365964 RepID=UPI0037F8D9F8